MLQRIACWRLSTRGGAWAWDLGARGRLGAAGGVWGLGDGGVGVLGWVFFECCLTIDFAVKAPGSDSFIWLSWSRF